MTRKAILAAAILLAGCGGNKPPRAPEMEFRQLAPDVFTVVIEPTADVAKTEAAIRKHCANKPICMVDGWTDPAAVAHAYPIGDRETAALVFSYIRNEPAGTEDIYWDCVRFRAARAPCLPKN